MKIARRTIACFLLLMLLFMTVTSAFAGSRCTYCGSTSSYKISTEYDYYIAGGTFRHGDHNDDEEILVTIDHHHCNSCGRNFEISYNKVVGIICSETGEYI